MTRKLPTIFLVITKTTNCSYVEERGGETVIVFKYDTDICDSQSIVLLS